MKMKIKVMKKDLVMIVGFVSQKYLMIKENSENNIKGDHILKGVIKEEA